MKRCRGRARNGAFKQAVKYIIPGLMVILSLAGCGKHEEDASVSAADQPVHKVSDILNQERRALLDLYDNPSVSKATIKSNLNQNNLREDTYSIDLTKATASIEDSERTVFKYDLDETQVEQLSILLSKYAITVYDDNPYWPTGNFCTMVQLFEFNIRYQDGHYREYGATHYPEGWDDFIRTLRKLITNEQELPVVPDANVYEGIYEYDGYIGNEPVHLSILIDEYQSVSGEYYYINSPEPVSITGNVKGDNLQLYNTIKNGLNTFSFIVLRDADGSLKGMWQGNGQEYACYLAESDAAVQMTDKPDLEWGEPVESFSGSWYGVKSDYYSNSVLRFVPLYDNLIYFDICTANGTYSGKLQGIGRIDGSNVTYVENRVVFTFTAAEDNNMMLNANNYQYKIHPTAPFESLYERRPDGLKLPERLSFMTKEENEQLKAITGDRYQEFLAVGQQMYQVTLAEAGDDLKLYDIFLNGSNEDAVIVINKPEGYMCAALKYYNEAEQRAEVHLFNGTENGLIREYINYWSGEDEIVVQD